MVVLAGLFTFPFFRILSALGLAGLVLLALFQPGLPGKLKGLATQKAFLALMGIFLLHALTLAYTDPAAYPLWEQGLVLKLPFLVLPFSLALLGPWPVRQVTGLYYVFFHLVLLAAGYSLVQYFLHYQQVNQSYHQAGVLPTPVHHVRFSLMVAFAVFIGLHLSRQGFYWRHRREGIWIGAMTLGLFVFLHVLAVRSGLLAFYGVLLARLGYQIAVRGKWKLGLKLAFFLLLVLGMSYQVLPTFRERLHYTLHDLRLRHDETKANNYPLTGRLYSYRVGLAVWQQRPLAGWGLGHYWPAIQQSYRQLYPGIQPRSYLIPHNQFLYCAGLLGLVGGACFLFCFYYPFWKHHRQADALLAVHYGLISVSFLFEATLETQVGLLYCLVFLVLPLQTLGRTGVYFVNQKP
ncbi:MAG: O-antigen ligase family protein [Adhaeribacter sp.]